jgi:CDP-paratose 2-epimerase
VHVLVTGGAGFIGCNVAASFLESGDEVTVLDKFSRGGSRFNLPWLHSLARDGQLKVIRADVRSAEAVAAAVKPGLDLVFHFAAQTAVTTSLVDPRDDLQVNLVGTFNVLEAVRRLPDVVRPAVFFTSTNKVYGSLPQRAIVEEVTRHRFADERLDARGIDESEPLDFHSPYGCSKGAADQYVRDYHRIYGLRTVVFRMSCIYGSRQFGTEDQGWVAHFFIAAARGQQLAIYGNGKQVRDLLFIDDLVRAFRLAAANLDVTAGRVYNIGGGPANALSVWRELRPRLESIVGREIQPTTHDWRPGDQPVYVSNTSAAARDFGWAPRIDLDEGLSRLWAWIQDQSQLGQRERKPRPVERTREPLRRAIPLDVA